MGRRKQVVLRRPNGYHRANGYPAVHPPTGSKSRHSYQTAARDQNVHNVGTELHDDTPSGRTANGHVKEHPRVNHGDRGNGGARWVSVGKRCGSTETNGDGGRHDAVDAQVCPPYVVEDDAFEGRPLGDSGCGGSSPSRSTHAEGLVANEWRSADPMVGSGRCSSVPVPTMTSLIGCTSPDWGSVSRLRGSGQSDEGSASKALAGAAGEFSRSGGPRLEPAVASATGAPP